MQQHVKSIQPCCLAHTLMNVKHAAAAVAVIKCGLGILQRGTVH